MEIIQLIRTLFGSMDSEYIQENDDKIIDLLEQAANTLEKLSDENKQFIKKFETLLKDFKELILNPNDVCKYCKHYQPCLGKDCESYVKGRGVQDLKGYTFDWQWTCEHFEFGTCPKLENTPCNGCIKHNMSGFEWRGVVA